MRTLIGMGPLAVAMVMAQLTPGHTHLEVGAPPRLQIARPCLLPVPGYNHNHKPANL